MKTTLHVVIIGRPNVGKSTLYNRLIGKRKALVHHVPGTTRDRNESEVAWKGRSFIAVDTGGWEDNPSFISQAVRKQMQTALADAGVVVFVVDGKAGFHPLDGEISSVIRKSGKKVLLVVNKIDNLRDELKVSDFYRLGIAEMVSVSGTHGLNIHEFLDKVCSLLPASTEEAGPAEEQALRIVLVGKPNVGKSSLLNALCKEERTIVHEQPGTTREAVDIKLERGNDRFVLIDTPGLHRKHKFTDDMDYLASLSAHHALERADIAVLVIDAKQGIGETEARIAELILENHRGCLIVINKWDIIEEREAEVSAIKKQLEEKLPFLWWSKVIYTSAKTGQRIERILSEAQEIYKEFSKRVPEDELSAAITAATHRKPLSRRGDQLKIRNTEQDGVCAPKFVFFVNRPDLVHFSYRRYLENALRERFGFSGTPLVLKFIRTSGGERKRR